MEPLEKYEIHMLQSLNTVPYTTSLENIIASVEQLQMWCKDDTELADMSVEELLEIHNRLQTESL